jgi:hypothetical protein
MEKDVEFVKTTIYMPKDLHVSAKMAAILTGKPLSYLMRVALAEKIKEIKEQSGIKVNS